MTGALQLRPAAAADAPFLAAIDASVNFNPWSKAQYERACAGGDAVAPAAVRLLEEGRVICGFIIFSLVLDQATIQTIAVRSERQGNGLGRVILVQALGEIKCLGALQCLLEVRRSNEIARHLYRSQGFVLDGVRKNYYPTSTGREDALLMSLAI